MKRKKGFTLIEFLAVIVILGVLSAISVAAVLGIITKSKEKYYKTQENNMVMAAQSYLKNNNKAQPKVSGQLVKINLEKLSSAKYIDKVVDYKKEECSGTDSYVNAFKYEDNIYYTAHLKCPNYETNDSIYTSNLSITASFLGDDEHLNASAVDINIKDTKTGDDIPEGIVSYQYKIYLDGELKYTSDIFNAKRSTEVNKNVKLTPYVPGVVKISISATNMNGATLTKSFTKSYEDNTAPTCTPLSGESTTWSEGARIVTVKCDDGSGSGCKRETYTYEFTGDVKVGKIEVEDKAGNKGNCNVNVYIDNYPPVIKLRAYKKKAGSLQAEGGVANSITTKKKEPIKELTITKDAVNGWLNKAKWPNGVYFELDYSDIDKVTKIEWNWNAINLPSSASNLYTVSNIATQTPNNSSGTVKEKVEDDGYRYGEIIATDNLNHKSVIKVRVPLDRIKPEMPTVGESTDWIKGTRDFTINCSDTISGCQTPPGNQSINTTTKTKSYTVKDNAGNAFSKDVNVYVDNTKPKCGTITGQDTKWLNTSRYIKVKCSDDESKCSKDEFDKTFNTTIQVGQITISDKVGNTRDCDVNAYIDKELPIVTTTAKNASSNNLTINLSDNIELAGYAITTTETEPSSWTSLTGKTFTKTFTKDTGTYYVYVKDKAGNVSHKSQYVLKMDPPTCSISLTGTKSGDWYTSEVKVKMTTSGTIAQKGLDTTQNSVNNKTEVTHTSSASSVTYYGYVKNAAGDNSCSKTFKVDRGPSKPSINLNGYGSGNWTNQDVTISASTSSHFDIKTWQYSHDKNGWSTGIQDWGAHYGTGHKSISSKITWDGQWTFYVRAIDENGIASPASDSFVLRVDKTPPRYVSVAPYCGNYWCLEPRHHAYVHLYFQDTGSGIARRYVEWWDSDYEYNHLKSDANFGGSTEVLEDVLDAVGTWQAFEHKLWDVAGNYSEWIDHYVAINCGTYPC